MNLQYISDSTGKTTGVFIPIAEWNALKSKYKGIEQEQINIPAWQTDEVRKRLDNYKNKHGEALDFDTAMKDIENDMQMYKAIILPLAKEDIRDAAAWYNSKQKGLGIRFTQEVRNKVSLIRQTPKIFAIRYNDVRTTVLDVFPFMIHYIVNDKENTVVIAAVFHTCLNPERWKHRK